VVKPQPEQVDRMAIQYQAYRRMYSAICSVLQD